MTDEILALNSSNELIAKDPNTGNVRPIEVSDLSASSRLNLDDGALLTLGSNDDFGLRYDATADSFVVADNTNGTDTVTVDRTTGDIDTVGDVSATNVSADTQMNSSSTRPNIFADNVNANSFTGVPTSDLAATQVGQDSGNKQPLSVSISNPSSFDQLVCIIQDFRNDDDAFLRFNNDNSGNTKYTHVDNSGNIVSGTDRFLLSHASGLSSISGTVVLMQSTGQVAIHNQTSYDFELSKMQTITHFGEYETGPVSQIELQQSRDFTNDATLTVFGR